MNLASRALRQARSRWQDRCRFALTGSLPVAIVPVDKETGRRAAPCLRWCALLLRLRNGAQIRLVRLEALRIFLLGVLVENRRRNDDVLARLPVYRRGGRIVRVQLKRVAQTQHLVEVTAG